MQSTAFVRASVCGVLLARRLATLGPEPGITRRMQYREDDHAPRFDAIEDAIGKAGPLASPSVGEHLVFRNDIVRISFVIC